MKLDKFRRGLNWRSIERWAEASSLSGFWPPIPLPFYPRAFPIVLISDLHFWLIDCKNFLKMPLALLYSIFGGRARAKKRNFLVRLFQKVTRTPFSACFSKVRWRWRKFGQSWAYIGIWLSSDNQFAIDLKFASD